MKRLLTYLLITLLLVRTASVLSMPVMHIHAFSQAPTVHVMPCHETASMSAAPLTQGDSSSHTTPHSHCNQCCVFSTVSTCITLPTLLRATSIKPIGQLFNSTPAPLVAPVKPPSI